MIKQLFLCHHRANAAEVEQLADALRIYGIKPWLDSQGGFQLGDAFTAEARRAIREDCFGLLFYATPEAFERPFIRKIELNEAIQQRERNPEFVIITVLRSLSVTQLGELSRRHLGVDLSLYHAYPLPVLDTAVDTLHAPMTDLAARILPRVLRQAASAVRNAGCLSLQLSSRDRLPDESEDVLFLDATRLMAQTSCDTAAWDTVASALFTVKNQVSQQLGRPRLKVHGSKHLTTATLFGHVFRAASGFQVEIRQKTEFWSTDCPLATTEPFAITEEYGSYHTSSLFVEIDATGKTVRDAVRRYIQRADVYPALSLRFSYFPARQGPIDNQMCCAMALQIRQTIATAVSQNEIADIHLFGAIPQGLALMIGHHLNALRTVQLYEYVQGDYYPSGRLLMERT